jgi:hypothetical protein
MIAYFSIKLRDFRIHFLLFAAKEYASAFLVLTFFLSEIQGTNETDSILSYLRTLYTVRRPLKLYIRSVIY